MQFISYLVVFGSSVEYSKLSAPERSATDRLLRMGVLEEADSESGAKKLRLTEAWRKAIESRRRDEGGRA
jgi:chromosome condensin MukBEF MukE localization factor